MPLSSRSNGDDKAGPDDGFCDSKIRHRKHGSTAAEREAWPKMRRATAAVIGNKIFEFSIAVVMMINLMCVVIETDIRASKRTIPPALQMASLSFLIVYALEIVGHIYVERWYYFEFKAHWLDVGIVLTDVIIECMSLVLTGVVLPSLSVLRVMRVLRLMRGVKFFHDLRELSIMLAGIGSAARAVIYATVLVLFTLTLWSIVAVEFIHPLNQEVAKKGYYDGCRRCEHAFESVFKANLTFIQQIIAGDSWGQVTMPIVEEYPQTVFFFLAVLVSVNLGVMNLILAVIVDAATAAREQDTSRQLQEKETAYKQMAHALHQACRDMDEDNSGTITYEEMLDGYDHNPYFAQTLNSMNCRREDLDMIFDLLDTAGQGQITFNDFVQRIYRMKTDNTNTVLAYLEHKLFQVQKQATEQMLMIQFMHSRMLSDASAKELQSSGLGTLDKSLLMTDPHKGESCTDCDSSKQNSSKACGFSKPENILVKLDILQKVAQQTEDHLAELVQRCTKGLPLPPEDPADTNGRLKGEPGSRGVLQQTTPHAPEQSLPPLPRSTWTASLMCDPLRKCQTEDHLAVQRCKKEKGLPLSPEDPMGAGRQLPAAFSGKARQPTTPERRGSRSRRCQALCGTPLRDGAAAPAVA